MGEQVLHLHELHVFIRSMCTRVFICLANFWTNWETKWIRTSRKFDFNSTSKCRPIDWFVISLLNWSIDWHYWLSARIIEYPSWFVLYLKFLDVICESIVQRIEHDLQKTPVVRWNWNWKKRQRYLAESRYHLKILKLFPIQSRNNSKAQRCMRKDFSV